METVQGIPDVIGHAKDGERTFLNDELEKGTQLNFMSFGPRVDS